MPLSVQRGRTTTRAVTKALAALAQPRRFKIMELIAAAGSQGIYPMDLISEAGVSQPTVSHHIKILIEAGLVTGTKQGVNLLVRVNPKAVRVLTAILEKLAASEPLMLRAEASKR